MFVAENPLETTGKLFDEIKSFGDLAGFFINKKKTKMGKNMKKLKQEELSRKVGCEITTKVKYLGINMTMKNLDLYKNNYETIRADLEKWKILKLSLLGRIALIKMNMLPKIMFLYQTIPIVKKNEYTR